MEIRTIKRNCVVEYLLCVIFGAIFCMSVLITFINVPQSKNNWNIMLVFVVFSVIFMFGIYGLIMKKVRKIAIKIGGIKEKLFIKNKFLFLMYTGIRFSIIVNSFLFIICLWKGNVPLLWIYPFIGAIIIGGIIAYRDYSAYFNQIVK